mgnify:CR=1 FL=1
MAEPKPQARHIPFTSSRIQAMKWDGRRSDIRYDSSPKAPGSGFGVRIYSSGRKSYVLQYRAKERVGGSGVLLKTVRGKVHLKVLGNVDTMGLSTAREIGLKLLDPGVAILRLASHRLEDRRLELGRDRRLRGPRHRPGAWSARRSIGAGDPGLPHSRIKISNGGKPAGRSVELPRVPESVPGATDQLS